MTEQEILAAVQDIFRDNFDGSGCTDGVIHILFCSPRVSNARPYKQVHTSKKYFRRPVPPFFRSFTAHEEDV